MKLYLATLFESSFQIGGKFYSRASEAEKYYRRNVQHILASYHYIHKGKRTEIIRTEAHPIFLDSGAFSAMNSGVEIDLRDYIQYVQANRDIIEVVDGQLVASVLDAVGNPQKTYENQKAMELAGVKPLPCFHYGEDERYLEYYVANYPYITLGGMVPISTAQLFYWLDRLWEKYLTDGSGRPRTRVHGFGLTSQDLMSRYPWFSVDSSSWQVIGSIGNILLPDHGTVSMSKDSPARKVLGRHFDNLREIEKNAIRKLFDTLGFEEERLRKDFVPRWAFNCWSFGETSRLINQRPLVFQAEQKGLF